uniref:glycosyl hydrolase family 28-related protein n=1 Tax=Kitasatospora sp. SC0581 TaxID=3394360 RepID=UPI003A8988CE
NGYRYNVKRFGAKGDGKTNDTKAIQKAINAIDKDKGGVIYFPTGNYLIKSSLVIKKKRKIEMKGDGMSSVIRAVGSKQKPVTFPLVTITYQGSSKFTANNLLFQMSQT